LFYGWRIVAVAFLCHCVTTGIVFYSFGVFLAPLAAEFGSHGRVALAFSAVALLGAVYSPPVGRLVDRYGPRGVQLAGAALLGTGLAVLGTVTRWCSSTP
jgi:MFS family permease